MFNKLFLSIGACVALGLSGIALSNSMANALDSDKAAVTMNIPNESPDAMVKRISQDVLDTAKKDADIQSGNQQKILKLVEKKIIPHVDFQHMTELAAGRNWRVATPAQQQELVNQFRTLLVYTYSGALSQVKDQTLEYKPFRADAGATSVEVRSQVTSQRPGQAIELDYRLAKGADGWKIYDINVMGAWLIETYKGNFTSEINKGGIDGLIKALTAKNASLAKAPSKKPT